MFDKQKSRMKDSDSALHHSFPVKFMFENLTKGHKPSQSDPAVGVSSLTEQGTAQIKFRDKLILHNSLYSPKSTSRTISADKLQRIGNIYPDYKNGLLIKHSHNSLKEPIARLVLSNDVYYIHSFHTNDTNTSNIIAAPDVARIPSTTSTQRWHQRLG
ncbi:hypothetical protein K3495_g9776 [Podosphaera aphanis]|nr:hypothetical protein K3495_g9776 [Podosphaera aphanis]